MYLIKSKSNSLTIFFGLFLKKELFVDFSKEGCRRPPAEAVNSDASCWVPQCVLAPSSLFPTSTWRHLANRSSQILYVTDQPPEESLTLNSSPKKKGQLRPGAPLPINSPQATDWLLRSVVMWKGKAFSQWP